MIDNEENVSSGLPMVKLLNILRNKYKVLSKLTQCQSQKFTAQIISLLVDENKNVDYESYKQIKKSIGIQAFVLEILGNTIDRNPFANQHALKNNIKQIQNDIQQKMSDINSKNRILARKQAQLNAIQSNLRYKIKQILINSQKQLIKKLTAKQSAIKKNINQLMGTLRTKQKIIVDKKRIIQQKLQQIRQERDRKVEYSNKQKQNRTEIVHASDGKGGQSWKQAETIKNMVVKCEKYESELLKLKKKNHNNQLAYRRIKLMYEKEKTLREQLQAKMDASANTNQNVDSNISQKHNACKNQNIHSITNDIHNHGYDVIKLRKYDFHADRDFEQLLEELELSTISTNNVCNDNTSKQIVKTQIAIHKNQKKVVIKSETQAKIPQNLHYNSNESQQMNNDQSDHSTILHKIQQLSQTGIDKLIKSGLLQQFCAIELYYWKPDQIVVFYDILLELLQHNAVSYAASIQYLAKPIFTEYLQKCYLSYQNNEQIAEATTLIISRICMQQRSKIEWDIRFRQAVSLRRKMINLEQQNMLDANIIYLAKMLSNCEQKV